MTAELARNIAIRGNKMAGRQNILDKPRAQFYRVTALNIANGTPTAIPWDTRDYDVEGMWQTAVNTRFTAVTAGLWDFRFNFSWAANATGYRQIYFQKNAGTVYAPNVVQPLTGIITNQSTSWHIPLNAGDYVEGVVAHNSGAPLAINVSSAADRECGFTACLIST